MSSIGLAGSYGGLNAGDEAILTVAVRQLRAAIAGVRIVAFSRSPEHTRAHHEVDDVLDAREALRDELALQVERLDLLLLGGGGLLYDRAVESYLRIVRIAQQRGVPTGTYAIGAGPLERPSDRQAVADVINRMQLVTVREAPAKRLLEEIGVERDIAVTADPALLLEPEPFTREMLTAEGISGARRLVGMSVREPGGAAVAVDASDYHDVLAHAADFVADRLDADLVFVPLERQDIRESHRVIAQMEMPERATVLKGQYAPGRLRGLMEHFDMAIGMRLHFLIFAVSAGVPVAALPYASKVIAFLESCGLPRGRLVNHEQAGTVLATIDRLWDLRETQLGRVRERLPLLRDAAAQTARMTAELLAQNAASRAA